MNLITHPCTFLYSVQFGKSKEAFFSFCGISCSTDFGKLICIFLEISCNCFLDVAKGVGVLLEPHMETFLLFPAGLLRPGPSCKYLKAQHVVRLIHYRLYLSLASYFPVQHRTCHIGRDPGLGADQHLNAKGKTFICFLTSNFPNTSSCLALPRPRREPDEKIIDINCASVIGCLS